VIGEAIRRAPVSAWIEHYERSIRTMSKAKAARAEGKAGIAPARKKVGAPKSASKAKRSGAGGAKAPRTGPTAGKKVARKAAAPARNKTGSRA
jgi:hypothetical protein